MRDQCHREQVERWAAFVRENPTQWKEPHTKFINALFQKHRQVMETLLETPGGKEKLRALYGFKNRKGYSWLD